MTTLIGLVNEGVLDSIDPLEAEELPWRTLYGTIDFLKWLDEILPTLAHNELYADLTPQEQVFAVFFEYVSGDYFSTDRRFKKLSVSPDHFVWEFKTDEIRIFGWIPHKNVFICCFGDSKDTIEVEQSYGKFIAQTAFVRNNMELDEPKCLTSGRYEDVISNKD